MTKAKTIEISLEYLRSVLDYDPLTGIFRWKARWDVPASTDARLFGTEAGTLHSSLYMFICLDGIKYKTHRLAWFYVTGENPPADVDHINGFRFDNRFSNLRLATRAQNMHNARGHRDNPSGFKGVSWSAVNGRWRARLRSKEHGDVWLGYYDKAEDAHRAYCEAAKLLHKEFAHF